MGTLDEYLKRFKETTDKEFKRKEEIERLKLLQEIKKLGENKEMPNSPYFVR